MYLAKYGIRSALMLSLLLALSAPAQGDGGTSEPYDLDNGNAAIDIAVPTVVNHVLSSVDPSDASLVLRIATMTDNGWFDAIAPYHPTAVGVASRLGRRPPEERATNRQRNIALLYATYRVILGLMPEAEPHAREMLTSVGLDPDNDSRNITSPVGIGNRAGQAVVASRLRDGMNQLGDEGGRKYNRQPYADYLGYEPVNTPETLHDPSRWQPNVVTTGNGIFRAQRFVTPQFGVTRPYSYHHPREFRVPPPAKSNFARNPTAYRRQAAEVVAASAALTDYQKLAAEHFNEKVEGLFSSVLHANDTRDYTLDQFVFHGFITNLAAFDTGIAVWHFKRRHDAVRPFSAIRLLYGDRHITAWGGPGQGRVSDITGLEWRSYIGTPDHPEYPAATAALCAAHAQASRQLTGTDDLGQAVIVATGASVIEPGATPQKDTMLGPWHTWTQWEQECALSRLWGGVHFRAAINVGSDLGTQVGDRAYEFLSAHIEGQPNDIQQP